MGTCFPAMRYLYFFILFLISFILIDTSKTLELLGLGLLFAVNAIFTFSLGNDVLEFMNRASRQTWLNGLATWSIIIGLVFNFVSTILMIITLNKLKTKYQVKGKPLKLSGDNRKFFNTFKYMLISSITLVAAVSLNIYFTADRLSTTMSTLLNSLTDINGNANTLIVQIAYALIATGLFGSLIDIVYFKRKGDEKLKPFKRNFEILFSMLIGLFAVIMGRVGISMYMRNHLEWFVNNAFGIDMLFDLLKWGFTIVSIVFSAFLIDDFIKIPDVDKVYKKWHFKEIFISFITFVLITLTTIFANTSYFIDLLLVLLKLLGPLALMGVSAYLIFASNKLSMMSRHELTE
jgi:hypothetical protein